MEKSGFVKWYCINIYQKVINKPNCVKWLEIYLLCGYYRENSLWLS